MLTMAILTMTPRGRPADRYNHASFSCKPHARVASPGCTPTPAGSLTHDELRVSFRAACPFDVPDDDFEKVSE